MKIVFKILVFLLFLFNNVYASSFEELSKCILQIVVGEEKQIQNSFSNNSLFSIDSNIKNVSYGTGFYYGKERKIFTNLHVIEEALNANKEIFNCQNSICEKLEIVAIEKEFDIAMLQNNEKTTNCKLSFEEKNDFSVDSKVTILSNKFGLGLGYVFGSVFQKNHLNKVHLIDANVGVGSSGAPVFFENTNKIIGILKSIYAPQTSLSGGVGVLISMENFNQAVLNLEEIVKISQILDFEIKESNENLTITFRKKVFFEELNWEGEESLLYINKKLIKSKHEALYLIFNFIKSNELELNLSTVSKSGLKIKKLKKVKF